VVQHSAAGIFKYKVVRIFIVKIYPEMREEYEDMFINVAVPYVSERNGVIEVWPGKPTKEGSFEYLFYSTWESLDAIIDFVGPDYEKATIPPGMEKFVIDCWVHHYQAFDAASQRDPAT